MRRIPKSKTRALMFCFALLLFVAVSAGAATLTDYRHRVTQAAAAIEQLRSTSGHDEPQTQMATGAIARVREELPAKETVMVNGQSVAVDNSWLHEALQTYEDNSNTKAQRAEALTRIAERLHALDDQLEEMQGGQPAANDKDGDKGKLAEILRRPEYNKNPTPEGSSALSRLWSRIVRWIVSLIPAIRPPTPGGSQSISTIIQIVLVVACLAAIAFLVWKFLPRYLDQRRARKKPKRETRIVLGERLEPDQTSADLLAQAEALARSGDLRAAIRKAYIALLCELGDRKIVSLAQHKTNRDYLNSVRERTRLYQIMRQLTSSFELHWYGFQPAVESDWNEFRNVYQQALKAGSPG